MTPLVRNAGWRAIAIAVDLARVAITMPIIARRVGASDYGRWSTAGTVIAVFMACIATGISDAMVRECALDRAGVRSLLRRGLRLRLAIAGLGVPALVLITALVADTRAAVVAAILGTTLVAEALATRSVLLTVHLADGRRLPSRIAITVVSTATIVVVAALGGGLYAFALVSALHAACAATAAAWVARPLAPPSVPEVQHRPVRRSLLAASWPLIVVSCLEVLYLQLDVIVVGAVVDARAAGVLGAAARIAYLPLLALGALTASALPELARLGPDAGRSVARELSRRCGRFALAAPVGLALAAPLAVAALGTEYAALRWLLPVLGLRVAIAAFTGPLGTYVLATGHQRANAAVSVALIPLQLVAVVALASRHGLAGAACAVILVDLIKALCLFNLSHREVSPCTSPF